MTFSKIEKIVTVFAIILLAVIIGGGLFLIFNQDIISLPPLGPQPGEPLPGTPGALGLPEQKISDIKKFSSEDEFKEYLQESQYYGGGFLTDMGQAGMARDFSEAPSIRIEEPGALPSAPTWSEIEPERVSETNVQVLGIDEPDIVKTNGKQIYFSSGANYYPIMWERDYYMPEPQGKVKVINAFPVENLSLLSEIEKQGDLLLEKNILVVFSGDRIYGYDVSDPKEPEEKWKIDLDNRNYIVSSRLYNGKLYVVSQSSIDTYKPCPITPFTIEGKPMEIRCVDIYHPVVNVPVNVAYTAMALDPASGKVEKTVSFVGNSGTSVLYMSENALYLTYSYYESMVDFFYRFLNQEGKDLVPQEVLNKLEKLSSYDISESSKYMELEIIFENWQNSLDDDERLKVENELANRMEDYYKKNQRLLERSGIVKIDAKDLKIEAVGSVPGKPLNQFALDEYENHLRVAVTVGDSWMRGGMGESVNDVYVLDKSLKIVGSVQDMGLEERIYSVRFLKERGYVVTFRQTDPFYVLDLSDPESPRLKGELKIPGYSSYLHPMSDDIILGVGKEGSQVKLSLFDVKDPQNPKEQDKYNLDEYWSDILNTHHAFLLDREQKVFFLPGSRGGYIFSYQGNSLKLEKAVSEISARRAVYIDDYMYIIGDDKLVVLDENTWERVKELEL